MNEIELIAGLDDTEQPSPAVLDAAFVRLAAEFDRPALSGPGLSRRVAARLACPRSTGPAVRWSAGAFAAAAAAAAAAVLGWVVLAGGIGGEPGHRHGAQGSQPTVSAPSTLSTSPPSATSPQSGTAPSPAPALTTASGAAQVLHAAANAERLLVETAPRPDQFLYVSDSSGYEAWLSMDGTHDGLVRLPTQTIPAPGCVDGYTTDTQTPCAARPAYRPDAPATAEAMAAYIIEEATPGNSNSDDRPAPSVNAIGKTLMSIARYTYLLPAARAALFEAIPLLPGLPLATSPVEGSNGALTAVSWTFGASTNSLIFDSASHAYVGYSGTISAAGTTGNTVPLAPTTTPTRAGLQPTESPGGIDVVRQAVVDAVGDRS